MPRWPKHALALFSRPGPELLRTPCRGDTKESYIMATKTVTTQTIKTERTPGGDVPEVIMNYLAMHPQWFEGRVSHERDTERLMRMSKKGIAKEDAESVAWLLWRARMVQGWSAVNRVPTKTWAECIESAWLKDELFLMCADKRKAFYAEQEARRNRLEQAVATGFEGDHVMSMNQEADAKAQRQATRRKSA